jgi:glyoxylase-like metal-dependent hydrolase (beta-lactamase superfamily II)
VHVPGHTPGSIAVHLPEELMVFLGDAAANVNGAAVAGFFNVDREQAVSSFRRLAELDFTIACFGHGRPLRDDAAMRFRETSGELA